MISCTGFVCCFYKDMNSTFTKTLKERIAQKQKQKDEEEERRRAEKERKRQEQEEKLKREKERQQEKLRRLSSSDSMGLESKNYLFLLLYKKVFFTKIWNFVDNMH